MDSTTAAADTSAPRMPQRKRGAPCTVAAIVGLQLLTAGAFGIMSPILSILMTEVSPAAFSNALDAVQTETVIEPTGNGDALSVSQQEKMQVFATSPDLELLCRENGITAAQFARNSEAVTSLDLFLGFWTSMRSVAYFPALRELSKRGQEHELVRSPRAGRQCEQQEMDKVLSSGV
ncbi:hypothetical protein PHYSODRAFT_324706 [Phytophthora sojae]|uniref:Uncharacterized protein n=1 Tax=Phytophthora sojae (strain P6497) TaxID=1094619 RepID=G4YSK9_PHYSP|nr:hypothetical protein PHYSODRAFT_324706 [Phytophthora sojae]EGZ23502.1 hypothetical protein PHYSODRAFT_324706 [Phytophthora sojae]|eukprot:XP_009518790.1 hypothetical protein PHYSODRAFT_324706 [Phytophthora sojae]